MREEEGKQMIEEGTLEDIITHLPLIREKIPEKADLQKEEVEQRLRGRKYGVILYNKTEGIFVWYEDQGSLYLWLGVLKHPGKGIGGKVLSYIQSQTSYQRWYVKTSIENKQALNHLKKFGFQPYHYDGNIVYLEYFPSENPQ